METGSGVRARRLAALAIAAAMLALLPIRDAVAAAPAAVVNGNAVAAGTLVPLSVDPDFDLWQVYSSADLTVSGTHGLSGGVYPGWLLDAFAFLYGRPDEARSILGIAESQWPGDPHVADSSTSNVADKCRFGGEFGIPQFMLDSCRSMFETVAQNSPLRASVGRSASGPRSTGGEAEGTNVTLGDGITAGTIRSWTDTSATPDDGTRTEAHALLADVVIGDLRIGEIRSTAVAFTRGTTKTSNAFGSIELVDVTYQGARARITDRGVFVEQDGERTDLDLTGVTKHPALRDVSDALAEQGFDVRLLPGFERVADTTASAEAGGLIVRSTQEPPKELVKSLKAACGTVRERYPEPVTTLSFDLGDNPLYSEEFPFNQMPPRAEVTLAVPPPPPCLGELVDRAVDLGVVLAPAHADARYKPLPPIRFRGPDIDIDIDGDGDRPGYESVGLDGGSPPFPGDEDGTTSPGSNDGTTEPPPAIVASPLGALAGRVELLYAVIFAALGALVVARGSFRRLIRL